MLAGLGCAVGALGLCTGFAREFLMVILSFPRFSFPLCSPSFLSHRWACGQCPVDPDPSVWPRQSHRHPPAARGAGAGSWGRADPVPTAPERSGPSCH